MAELIKDKVTSFMVAMKDFFGLKDSQTLTGFNAEIKMLTDDDREYFKKGLREIGYTNVA